jgi:hypothetical protein
MGMSSSQVLFKVELPLAMPVLLAGIRTATVINVGVANNRQQSVEQSRSDRNGGQERQNRDSPNHNIFPSRQLKLRYE